MFKKLYLILLVFFFLLSLPIPKQAEQITILHTNDTHSHLFPFGNKYSFGGIARMSTLIRQLRKKNNNVLVVNSGDVFVGTFAFNKYLGYAELKIMETMYDVMCLGNHEFDLGPTTLAGIISGQVSGGDPVRMPMLCANVDLEAAGLSNMIKPYIIKYVGPFRVGIIGVVTTDPFNYSDEVNSLLTDPYKAAKKAARILKKRGCHIVICLSHLGQIADVTGLSLVPGIDVIIGGHTHDVIEQPIEVNNTIIVQSGEYGKYLGELKVNFSNGQVSVVDYKLHSIDKKIKRDPRLLQTLMNLKLGIQFDPRFSYAYTAPIARAAWHLEQDWEQGNYYRDTPLGNLVADAIKIGVKNSGITLSGDHPLIALEALGYIGHRVYKGKVVGNDILRAVPYGYDPVTGLGFKINAVLLAGAQLLGGLEYSVSMVEYMDDLSLQSSGLTFEYDSTKPPIKIEELLQGKLSRIDPTSVKINGNPINPQGLYWVALSEPLHKFLKSLQLQPFGEIETGLFEYDLVKDYMQELKVLRYKSEGRIKDTSLLNSSR